MDRFRAFACPGNIPGVRHSHKRIHIKAERLLEAQSHVAGQVGPGIQKTGERRARHAQHLSRLGDRKPMGLDDQSAGSGRDVQGLASA